MCLRRRLLFADCIKICVRQTRSKTSGTIRGANSRLTRVLQMQNTGGQHTVVSVKPIAAARHGTETLQMVLIDAALSQNE